MDIFTFFFSISSWIR